MMRQAQCRCRRERGSVVAVRFNTRKRGEVRAYRGVVARVMARSARVEFDDVDNTTCTYDVEFARLLAVSSAALEGDSPA